MSAEDRRMNRERDFARLYRLKRRIQKNAHRLIEFGEQLKQESDEIFEATAAAMEALRWVEKAMEKCREGL